MPAAELPEGGVAMTPDRRWLRLGAALVCGVLAATALPTFYFLPGLWVGFSGLLYLIVSASGWKRAAFEGWVFGLGWFALGLYWIGYAFLVDAAQHAFLMPFAVIGISVGMAIYPAVVGGFMSWLVRRVSLPVVSLPVIFAATWTVAEWIRSIVLTGFPWNPVASIWGISEDILQSISWMSALGLGFVTIAACVAPAILVLGDIKDRRRSWVAVIVLTTSLPILWGTGWMRLSNSDTATHDGVLLRLVQPSIPQHLKWKPDLRQGHLLKQLALSKRGDGPAGSPTHVIWAETNVPYLITDDGGAPAPLAAGVPASGHMIFGAPRRDSAGQVFNSLMAINDNGDIEATFDKFHLVPFGEYVPLRAWIPFEKLTAGRGDFTPGAGPAILNLDGLPPFAAIICYEVIFSGNVIDPDNRPEWILNITNDAWFGPSTGPRQHLVQARLRAIEEGLPVVRVANTGISAVIDPYGRVRNKLELEETGIIDAPLPEALPPTVFSHVGQLPALILSFLIVIGVFALPLVRRNTGQI